LKTSRRDGTCWPPHSIFNVETGNIAATVRTAGTNAQFHHLRGTVNLISKALTLVEPGLLEAGYLHGRLGNAFRDESGDFESELQEYDRAMKIANQFGDRRLEGRINIHYGQHYDWTGEPQKVIEYCRKADDLARETDDALTERAAVLYTAWASVGQWDIDAVRILEKRAIEIGERLRLFEPTLFSWELAIWEGDWTSANSLAGAELERTRDEKIFLRRKIAIQAYIGTEFSEQEWGEGIAGFIHPTRWFGLTITEWIAARGNHVSDWIEEWLESHGSSINASLQRVNDMARTARALATGDDDSMSGLYDGLSRFAGWWDVLSGTAVDHLLGMLADRMANYEEAAEHFEYVIKRSREVSFRPTLALVSADYAEMLITRGASEDTEKATELQDEAIAIATELGMQPLLERVLAQRDILKA